MTTDPNPLPPTDPLQTPGSPLMAEIMADRLLQCHACKQPATLSITFAYDARVEQAIHPLFHTYPMPMHYSCGSHVGALMATDSDSHTFLVGKL